MPPRNLVHAFHSFTSHTFTGSPSPGLGLGTPWWTEQRCLLKISHIIYWQINVIKKTQISVTLAWAYREGGPGSPHWEKMLRCVSERIYTAEGSFLSLWTMSAAPRAGSPLPWDGSLLIMINTDSSFSLGKNPIQMICWSLRWHYLIQVLKIFLIFPPNHQALFAPGEHGFLNQFLPWHYWGGGHYFPPLKSKHGNKNKVTQRVRKYVFLENKRSFHSMSKT